MTDQTAAGARVPIDCHWCGGAGHAWCGPAPADEGRRQQYAGAIRQAGDTAYGHRPFYDAIADAVMAVADAETAQLRQQLADAREQIDIDTKVMEKGDRDYADAIAAGRAFRQQAEQAQAWGEQHRDRANRYRARLRDAEAALARVRALHQPLTRVGITCCAHCSGWDGRFRCHGVVTPYPCPTLTALDPQQ